MSSHAQAAKFKVDFGHHEVRYALFVYVVYVIFSVPCVCVEPRTVVYLVVYLAI